MKRPNTSIDTQNVVVEKRDDVEKEEEQKRTILLVDESIVISLLDLKPTLFHEKRRTHFLDVKNREKLSLYSHRSVWKSSEKLISHLT